MKNRYDQMFRSQKFMARNEINNFNHDLLGYIELK